MEDLTKTQIVLLTLLVSFMTSLATGIVTVSLVNQAPAPFTQTVHKVIEKIVPVENENNNQQQAASAIQSMTPESREEAIVKIINNVSSAVVSVIATKDIPVMEQYYVNPFGGDDFLGQFFGETPGLQIPQYRQKGTEKKQISSGTGFFVSKDGLLLTNKHVVEDTQADYSVVMNDGRKLEAKVLARDPFQDIAILKISGDNSVGEFNFLSLGNSDILNVGQTVIAIGNALGEFRNTVSVGIVSGLNRSITAYGSSAGGEQLQELIQTDAAINPGNSGGPLLNLSGKVIGINTAVAQTAENIGFALPINIAKRDIGDAVEFGSIKYPYLGIRYKVVDEGVQLAKGSNGEPAVEKDSPADKAGLKEGDIILGGVNTLLSKYRVGETVEIKILRDAKEMTVKVVLGERPSSL